MRPAKATIRRMIVEVLSKLEPLAPLNQYRYVGMGSIFFRDFQVIHRRLGIDDMITIEGDHAAAERVRFNIPLACVSPMIEQTSTALPKIALESKPHIIWLDYEQRVDQQVLADVDEAVLRCAKGSVVIVSVNADRWRDRNDRESWLSDLGPAEQRPNPKTPSKLREYALLSYRVLRTRLDSAIRSRNAGLPASQQVVLRQVLHLLHKDGQQMLNVGAVLVGRADEEKWNACGIEPLEFVRSGEVPFKVEVPILTKREADLLLGKMPDTGNGVIHAAEAIGLTRADARRFANVYR